MTNKCKNCEHLTEAVMTLKALNDFLLGINEQTSKRAEELEEFINTITKGGDHDYKK